MPTQEVITSILYSLEKMYPEAECSLDNDGDPFHLLVRAILSAQCTDKRVNELTKTLFIKYPGMQDFSSADVSILGEEIRSCGLFRAKSRAIIQSSQTLLQKFGGGIPSALPDLESLPGVGRKIANLMLGELYGVPAIVVDTHCSRVAKRLGLSESDNPAVVERDLMACIPKDKWITLGHRFVAHGRALCTARNPACKSCELREVCFYAKQSSAGRFSGPPN
jgi:endonuclease-3